MVLRKVPKKCPAQNAAAKRLRMRQVEHFRSLFVVIEIAFMDNQAQITETVSRLDSEKVR